MGGLKSLKVRDVVRFIATLLFLLCAMPCRSRWTSQYRLTPVPGCCKRRAATSQARRIGRTVRLLLADAEGQLHLELTVEPDGRVSKYELPPGVEPWQKVTAECVIPRLRFEPATRGGVPFTAMLVFPLTFERGERPVLSTLLVPVTLRPPNGQ